MKSKIVIVGAGGLGREALRLIQRHNAHSSRVGDDFEILGFIDDLKSLWGQKINGAKVLGGIDFLKRMKGAKTVVVIGDSKIRKSVVQRIRGIKFFSCVDPSVSISRDISIGKGTLIQEGVILTCNIRMGNHCYINLDCTIGHDVILENFVTLDPSVNVSGNAKILEGSHIHTNAVICPSVVVGRWSIVGAGAVVLNDVPDYTTVVGVPAKPLKHFGK
ncbi:MAG: acetyltransferase [Candidatus Bathyarchaeota archaeon]|jgi:sugar O-acyltransferase (sialic acid O-acetyltransferase NeuD family)